MKIKNYDRYAEVLLDEIKDIQEHGLPQDADLAMKIQIVFQSMFPDEIPFVAYTEEGYWTLLIYDYNMEYVNCMYQEATLEDIYKELANAKNK